VAEVLETRDSPHMGDVTRGLAPSTPEVGEIFSLGQGTLWVSHDDGYPVIGLAPDDGRDYDWLNPEWLYRLHNQTVRLTFAPDGEAL
jgi:hypothetical protein